MRTTHPLLVAQVAGTGVTTFVYMVARGDGLFYPSKVGQVWPNGSVEGTDASDFEMACYWRAPPTPHVHPLRAPTHPPTILPGAQRFSGRLTPQCAPLA